MAVGGITIPQWQQPRDLDFSSLQQLPQVYQQAQARQTLANLPRKPDGSIDTAPLYASGDMSLAQLGMQLDRNKSIEGRDTRDFGFRQQEAQRAQQNADRAQQNTDRSFQQQAQYQNRSLGIQERQLTEKPTIQKVKDAAGNESLVQVYPDGRSRALSPSDPVAAREPNNPYAPDGKQTEGQANASLYARRMFEAEKELRNPANVAASMSMVQRGIDQAPIVGASGKTGLGNYLQSKEYQKFDQAQRNFINATLRRESGAVISDAEFDNARKQYFPRPGDAPEVLAQKQQNRIDAIKGIAGAAGPAYKTPYSFDDAGGIKERAPAPSFADRFRGGPSAGSPAQAAPRDFGTNGNAILDQARDAISRGADPAKVRERLQQNGIDPGSL